MYPVKKQDTLGRRAYIRRPDFAGNSDGSDSFSIAHFGLLCSITKTETALLIRVFYGAAVRLGFGGAYGFAGGQFRQSFINIVNYDFFLLAHW